MPKPSAKPSAAPRFVPVKSVEKQAVLSLHRIRSAVVADPAQFDNGRQLAAWLGLVPRQYSTGGKTRLGRIAKQGDKYLRMLLVHGARSVLASLKDKQDRISCWLTP